MKIKIFLIFLTIFLLHTQTSRSQFVIKKRVDNEKIAIREKRDSLVKILQDYDIKLKDLESLFVIYKEENQLVVYAKNWYDLQFKQVATYEICFQSGDLGPKKCKDIYQVPEGFYRIYNLSKYSDDFLALTIDFPNLSDKHKYKDCKHEKPVEIHGGCSSVGGVAMTDELIKYIYLFALYSSPTDEDGIIHVYIFPFKMTEENLLDHNEYYKHNDELLWFWSNLMEGYERFIKHKQDLKYFIDKEGNYIFIDKHK